MRRPVILPESNGKAFMAVMVGVAIIRMHMERNEVDAGTHSPLFQLFHNLRSSNRQPV